MLSLSTIKALNDGIAIKALEERRIPYVPAGIHEVERYPPFPFPSLGSYVPSGWEVTGQAWFVDKTGHGHENEPALTVWQLREELRRYITKYPDHGFAITEEGPFQVIVGAMRRVRRHATEVADE
jgi:hypothetical protein